MTWQRGRDTIERLLAVQGLRPTTRGGHVAVQDAVRDQFSGRGGVPVFGRLGRLRRQRNATEYPAADSPTIMPADATACLGTAGEMVAAARRLLDAGRLSRWG